MTINEKASQLAFEYLRRNSDNLLPSEFLNKYNDAYEQFFALLKEQVKPGVTVWDIMH